MVIHPVIIGPGEPGHPGFLSQWRSQIDLLVLGYLGVRNLLYTLSSTNIAMENHHF